MYPAVTLFIICTIHALFWTAYFWWNAVVLQHAFLLYKLELNRTEVPNPLVLHRSNCCYHLEPDRIMLHLSSGKSCWYQCHYSGSRHARLVLLFIFFPQILFRFSTYWAVFMAPIFSFPLNHLFFTRIRIFYVLLT